MTVGIIIPSKNRSDFLIRQMAYYAEVGCKHKLFIGDSSEGQHLESTLKAISKLKDQIAIDYVQLPELTEYEAIKEIAQRVEDPFVALASDDDFFIPSALEDCASFLNSNSDYNSAHGLAVSFAVGLDWACGEFVRAGECPQRTSENSNGRLRLLEFLESYLPARSCVYRTGDFRDAAGLALKPADKDFRELLANCVPIIRGKSKQLDRLYLMRQAYIQYSPLTYVFDWVTGPDWYESYQMFRDHLLGELERQDQVGKEEAEEVVKEGFQAYMVKRLAKTRTASTRSLAPGPPPRPLRRAAGAVPGIRRMWRLGRSIRTVMPAAPDRLSLSELMRPSSPYHADFMPVYRAITIPAD